MISSFQRFKLFVVGMCVSVRAHRNIEKATNVAASYEYKIATHRDGWLCQCVFNINRMQYLGWKLFTQALSHDTHTHARVFCTNARVFHPDADFFRVSSSKHFRFHSYADLSAPFAILHQMESIHFNNGIVNWFDKIGCFDGITLHYRQATI